MIIYILKNNFTDSELFYSQLSCSVFLKILILPENQKQIPSSVSAQDNKTENTMFIYSSRWERKASFSSLLPEFKPYSFRSYRFLNKLSRKTKEQSTLSCAGCWVSFLLHLAAPAPRPSPRAHHPDALCTPSSLPSALLSPSLNGSVVVGEQVQKKGVEEEIRNIFKMERTFVLWLRWSQRKWGREATL